MLSKQCLQCGVLITKKDNCSFLAWEVRVKYCSKECSNAFRSGKPSCSPQTTFKVGQVVPVPFESRRRGKENNKWKGGDLKLICRVCGTGYEVDRYRTNSKTCSVLCRQVWQCLPENRLAMSVIHRKRVNLGLHNLYRGISQLKDIIRHCAEYKIWRDSVFQNDNYSCQNCGFRGTLNADHIKSFAVILIENSVKTFDDAINCSELWDVSNGRTLCLPCHKKTESYGKYLHAFVQLKVEKTTINL